MKRENKAKSLMIVSMFIFGTLAPFVRNPEEKNMKKTIIEKVLVILGKKRTKYPQIMDMIIQNQRK